MEELRAEEQRRLEEEVRMREAEAQRLASEVCYSLVNLYLQLAALEREKKRQEEEKIEKARQVSYFFTWQFTNCH